MSQGGGIGRRARLRIPKSSLSKHRFALQKLAQILAHERARLRSLSTKAGLALRALGIRLARNVPTHWARWVLATSSAEEIRTEGWSLS